MAGRLMTFRAALLMLLVGAMTYALGAALSHVAEDSGVLLLVTQLVAVAGLAVGAVGFLTLLAVAARELVRTLSRG